MAANESPRKGLILHVSMDGKLLRSFVLDQDRIRIGRDAAAEVRLCPPDVSRVHCVIEREGEAFIIADNGSTNGMLVNGSRMRFKHLQTDDVIQIGAFSLLVCIASTTHDPLFPVTSNHADQTIRKSG